MVATAWQRLCVTSLSALCKHPLRQLARAFEAQVTKSGSICHPNDTRGHAILGQSCHVALTPGEIIARVVVFEMLGPWSHQRGVYDAALPAEVTHLLAMTRTGVKTNFG